VVPWYRKRKNFVRMKWFHCGVRSWTDLIGIFEVGHRKDLLFRSRAGKIWLPLLPTR
jgi:hypothetical protein